MVHGAVPEFRAPGFGLGTTSLLKFVTTHWRGFKVRLKINRWCCSSAPYTTSPRRCGPCDRAAAAARQLQLPGNGPRRGLQQLPPRQRRAAGGGLLWPPAADCLRQRELQNQILQYFLFDFFCCPRPRLGGAATPLASLDGSSLTSLASRNCGTNV